jgi:hypothetical protein
MLAAIGSGAPSFPKFAGNPATSLGRLFIQCLAVRAAGGVGSAGPRSLQR